MKHRWFSETEIKNPAGLSIFGDCYGISAVQSIVEFYLLYLLASHIISQNLLHFPVLLCSILEKGAESSIHKWKTEVMRRTGQRHTLKITGCGQRPTFPSAEGASSGKVSHYIINVFFQIAGSFGM